MKKIVILQVSEEARRLSMEKCLEVSEEAKRLSLEKGLDVQASLREAARLYSQKSKAPKKSANLLKSR